MSESKTISLIAVPTIICVVAGLALAFVYGLTKEPIAQAQLKAKNAAIAKVLPAGDESHPVMGTRGIDDLQSDQDSAADLRTAGAVRSALFFPGLSPAFSVTNLHDHAVLTLALAPYNRAIDHYLLRPCALHPKERRPLASPVAQ